VHNSVILNDVTIGRKCRIKNAIIDKHVTLPDGLVIGYDRKEDEKKFIVSDFTSKKESGWLTVVPKQRNIEKLPSL
jgi:glucose-1-phosphate adenylyltransferase